MKKRILGVPSGGAAAIILLCITGIVIGSWKDFQISVAFASKTDLGAVFATYGSCFSYCLYPAAGTCLYKGLIKKGASYRFREPVV